MEFYKLDHIEVRDDVHQIKLRFAFDLIHDSRCLSQKHAEAHHITFTQGYYLSFVSITYEWYTHSINFLKIKTLRYYNVNNKRDQIYLATAYKVSIYRLISAHFPKAISRSFLYLKLVKTSVWHLDSYFLPKAKQVVLWFVWHTSYSRQGQIFWKKPYFVDKVLEL